MSILHLLKLAKVKRKLSGGSEQHLKRKQNIHKKYVNCWTHNNQYNERMSVRLQTVPKCSIQPEGWSTTSVTWQPCEAEAYKHPGSGYRPALLRMRFCFCFFEELHVV